MEDGFDGLLRDKTRPSRIAPLGDEIAEPIVALKLEDPPLEATRWTGAMMAKARRFCQLRSAHLTRPRPRAAPDAPFQALQRSQFIDKLRDVVGFTSILRPTRSLCVPKS